MAQSNSKTEYKVTDLCDAHFGKVQIADNIGLLDFGGRKTFGGEIHTLRCFEDHAGVEKILRTDGRGKVLVVDAGASLRCAVTGDRLVGIGVDNQWNGIIIYGAIRDSATIARLDIGLKALGTYPISRVTDTDWPENIPVSFAAVTFVPGHFVYCDEDGIIVSETALTI